MAASGAIGLSWKRRARWEPAEEDVPKGAQKVGGLLTAVSILVVWYWLRDPDYAGWVTGLAILLLVSTSVFLLAYGLLIQLYVYDQEISTGPEESTTRKIIGGLWLTPEARESRAQHRVTVQDLFRGAAYDADKVWPRLSRGLAKICFIISYIGFAASGTVALACAAILLA